MAVAGYGGAPVNPGLLLVAKLWAYCRTHAPGTRVMASGIRTPEEAKALAGVDFLVLGPKVMAALAASTTLEGYNDGLSAAEEENAGECFFLWRAALRGRFGCVEALRPAG